MELFSSKNRAFHLGPYPLEKLARASSDLDLSGIPDTPLPNYAPDHPDSLAHAMGRYAAMMDTVRDGAVAHGKADIPDDPSERSRHLKAAGYYFDCSMAGVSRLAPSHFLNEPRRNPDIEGIRRELEAGQPTSYAAGVDAIYADILAASRNTPNPVPHHGHALVFLVEFAREPAEGEPGTEWFRGTQLERASLLASNTAVVIANYIRMLGYEARAHSMSTSDVDLYKLSVSAGLCGMVRGRLCNAFARQGFGLAAVTTDLELEPDRPLARNAGRDGLRSHGPDWWLGRGLGKRAATEIPFAKREFRLGPHPFENQRRVDSPTTFIDEERVPRFPKRADFFARALFGDMGPAVQDAAKGGHYVMKSPIGACARRALGALLLLQFGDARNPPAEDSADPARNADNIKGASYYLTTDAVGLSRAPEWAYYSHDSGGNPLSPYHENAISMLFDQGFDTMEGASGDDWISVAQSMRAYLRFSLVGGVVAEQIRRKGFSARVHSVLDSEVLQPPLLLLSGLGEVSRIGEVILNPYLGPRLKAGTVTTSMPMSHDKPIDFGLQKFCESCNKCARECPSGAITAGPKLMYNGYEIWKSDAEKCTRYRLTNSAGGMCGRCMKTCPWNLEGLFAEAPFRWLASNVPRTAKTLAKLDDRLGRGSINPIKKWWWDIELDRQKGAYVKAKSTNERGLQTSLDLKYEDQTLAVYPADTMPPPYPLAHPLDREEGIERYKRLLAPEEYLDRLRRGESEDLAPAPKPLRGPPPVVPVVVAKREDQANGIARFELSGKHGESLPRFEAGAHVDVVVAPEYQRQFSLAGDPEDRSKYVLGVQQESLGRGGSELMFRIFREGRKTFVSRPRNQFPLDESASFSLLMAGGIGVTPLISMAYRLHRIRRPFELHYSARSADSCGFVDELRNSPWSDRVAFHFSSQGGRPRLADIVPSYQPGFKIYACGGSGYMDAVFDAAEAAGWPEDACLREYFSVPELPEKERWPFKLRLASTGMEVEVPAEHSAVEALAERGIFVETKCSDGICGVCATPLIDGEVDHRDYVLSKKERKEKVILCCSRAAEENGELVVGL
ncbi:MAG: 4Fe-4S dicluster domain-containing protein [Albidovulum sp.]|nr:4Fe-4S dicluster domain-containing protein [Albidovulum sp.]